LGIRMGWRFIRYHPVMNCVANIIAGGVLLTLVNQSSAIHKTE
jgi:hypothetical protein